MSNFQNGSGGYEWGILKYHHMQPIVRGISGLFWGDPPTSDKVFFMIDSQNTPIGEYFLTGYAICTLEQLSETRFFEKEARFFGFSRF